MGPPVRLHPNHENNMQSFVSRTTTFALALCTLAATLAPESLRAQAAEILSNTSVANMVTGKVSKDLILTKIRTTKQTYDVTAGGLVRLNQGKIPQDVILAMMAAAADPKLAGGPASAPEVITNQEVIQMVMGQVPRPIIIEKIRITKAKFDVTSDGLVNLQSNKVPDEIVKAMMIAPVAK